MKQLMWIFFLLDLSETLMYDFYYNNIKDSHVKKARPLFTDTDSLTYEIKANYMYEDFYKNKDTFDFSEYRENSKFYIVTNKKVIGKLKNETKDIPIAEFGGLKTNMLSFIKEDNKLDKNIKGINKDVVKKIKPEKFINILFEKKQIRQEIKRIQNKSYQIVTYNTNKISLACFDDMRN